MIASDQERAVARAQPSEGRNVPRKVVDRSIDQVSCHGDEVGIETIHGIDNRIYVLLLDLRADMHVADLRNRKPLQCRGQIRQGHLYSYDPRPATCSREAD